MQVKDRSYTGSILSSYTDSINFISRGRLAPQIVEPCTKTVHFQFKLSFLSDLKPPWCSFLTVSLYGTRIKEEEKKIVCQGEVFLPFPFMAL